MTNQTITIPADSSAFLAVLRSIDESLKNFVSLLGSNTLTNAPESARSVAEVTLPNFVSHEVRVSKEASTLFVDTLRRVGDYVGRNLTKEQMTMPEFQPYLGWKWHHLYQALANLGIIDANTKHNAFAEFLAKVLPGKKEKNISRAFYRNYDNNESIVADIEDTFRPVKALCHSDKF